MILELERSLLGEIQSHGEAAYPEEGAGVLLGIPGAENRCVTKLMLLPNQREPEARHNRYLITPQDLYRTELSAEAMSLEVIGIFHSHPDHPPVPSVFDREWAMPWFSYIITSVISGAADGSRSWRLSEDRQQFHEEQIRIIAPSSSTAASSQKQV